MAQTLILHQGWSDDISNSNKKIAAYVVGILSLVFSVFYSTPNTCDIFLEMWGDVEMLRIPYSGAIASVILGVSINILEYVGIILTVWKKNWLFFVGSCLIGLVSIYGSVKFNEKGAQLAAIKTAEVDGWSTKIEDIRTGINTDAKEIEDYSNQISYLQAQGKNIPSYLFQRKREAVERKAGRENELLAASDSSVAVKKRIGVIMAPGDTKTGKISFMSIVAAVFIEALLIGLAWLSLALFEPSADDVMAVASQKADTLQKKNLRADHDALIERLATRAVSKRLQQKIETSPLPHNGNGHSYLPSNNPKLDSRRSIYNRPVDGKIDGENSRLISSTLAKLDGKIDVYSDEKIDGVDDEKVDGSSNVQSVSDIFSDVDRTVQSTLEDANAKRFDIAQTRKMLVFELLVNHPELSLQQISDKLPGKFHVKKARVGQIVSELKTQGLVRKDKE